MLKKILKKCSAVLVLRKKTLMLVAGAMAVVLIFYIISSPAVVGTAATTRLLPIYSVERDNKAVSLTFDAAWGNEDTQMLIDILDQYNVSATFFVTGQWVDKFPESVKALYDAGHEVMNHSNDHAHFNTLTAEEITANINACSDKVEKITGQRPTLFRAPYGEYDDHVIAAVNAMGIYTIQWDCDSLDWKEISAQEIYTRVTTNVKSGSIVLFHNAALHTPEALPNIIEYLLQNGYDIVPVSKLILTGNYTIDHTGRQFPA